MSKEFKNLNVAMEYRDEMKSQGKKAYIEELWNFDGKFYMVLVW